VRQREKNIYKKSTDTHTHTRAHKRITSEEEESTKHVQRERKAQNVKSLDLMVIINQTKVCSMIVDKLKVEHQIEDDVHYRIDLKIV